MLSVLSHAQTLDALCAKFCRIPTHPCLLLQAPNVLSGRWARRWEAECVPISLLSRSSTPTRMMSTMSHQSQVQVQVQILGAQPCHQRQCSRSHCPRIMNHQRLMGQKVEESAVATMWLSMVRVRREAVPHKPMNVSCNLFCCRKPRHTTGPQAHQQCHATLLLTSS